jgi:hypothetical protein
MRSPAASSKSAAAPKSTAAAEPAAHTMKSVVAFELGSAAWLDAPKHALVPAWDALLELRRSELPGARPAIKFSIARRAAGVWLAETTPRLRPRPGVESIRNRRIGVRNPNSVRRVVGPCLRPLESALAEFAISVSVEEVVVYDDRASEPVRSPSPTAPAAASAKIQAK